MSILVVGATGFVGGEIARKLAMQNHKVAGLVRGGNAHHKAKELLLSVGIEVIAGDLCSPETSAIQGGLPLPHPTANRSTEKPDEGSLELTEEIMQARAYRFFEERGYEHGHDLEDWLRAEAEVFGKKPAVAKPADIVGGIRATVA